MTVERIKNWTPPMGSYMEKITDWVQRHYQDHTEESSARIADFTNEISITDLNDLANTSLADPDADRMVFWDDSDGQYEFLTPGSGFEINTNILNLDKFVDARRYASFATAISTIGATETTLVIPSQIAVTDNATVPATLQLKFLRGGSLNISNTKVVTINGHVDAGPYQIFEGAGSVSFGAGSVKEAYPEWWGADNSGATSSTSAFNATLASGCLKPALQPGASYKIKDVALPQVSGFHLKGNWATIIPDTDAATCFTATITANIQHYVIEKMFVAGDVTDFIKITQSGASGYMGYWHFQDIHAVSGEGSSLVKLIIDNAANPECLYVLRMSSFTPALFDHILYLTQTDGSNSFGSVICEDLFLNQGSSVGQSVIYSDIATEAVFRGRFNTIFGSRGNVINLNAGSSQFSNIFIEVSENDCVLMTGTFTSCRVDGLFLLNYGEFTGDKIFVGSMLNTTVQNVVHWRTWESLGTDITVNLDATSRDNYWNDLRDYFTGDNRHWESVADLGTNNTFNEMYGGWTPVDASGASLALTVEGQSAFTKKDNMIWASCRITYPTTADGNSAVIGGLVHTIANNLGNCGGGTVTLSDLGTAITVLPLQNTKTLGFYKIGGAAYTNAELSEKLIIFSVQYQVAQ